MVPFKGPVQHRFRGRRLKIEAGFGIREILRAGYGMKITWWDRDSLSSIGGMWDSFEIDGEMRDLKTSNLLKI